MLTQKEFVEGLIAYYKENDITPGDPEEGSWDQAHYPLPKGMGDKTILLLHDHHQVQGLLQSEEVGHVCFWSADVKRFLMSKEASKLPYDVVNDLWHIYRYWMKKLWTEIGKTSLELGIGIHDPANKEAVREGGKKGGPNSAEKGVGIHDPANAQVVRNGRSKGGKKGGKIAGKSNADNSVGLFDPTNAEAVRDGCRKGSKITTSQKWISTADGFISHSGVVAIHNKSIGAPKDARRRLTDKEFEALKDVPQDQRLELLATLSV